MSLQKYHLAGLIFWCLFMSKMCKKNTFDQIFKSCSSVYRIIFLYTNAIPCLTEKTLLIFCSYNSGDQTLSEIQRFMIDEIFPFYSSKFIIHLEYETQCRYFFHLSTGKKKNEMKKLPKYVFVFPKYGKFWSGSLEHSIKHKCFTSEECGCNYKFSNSDENHF